MSQLSQSDYEKQEATTYPVFLDLPPSRRWDNIPVEFCQPIKDFQEKFESFFVNRTFKTIEKYNEVAADLESYLGLEEHKEIKEEIEGIAKRCSIPFKFLAMYNFMYEFGQLGCSAIIFKFKEVPLLMKNLDYYFHDLFIKIIFKAKYFKNGRELFEAEQIFGFVGAVTAANKQVAVTLNAKGWKSEGDLDKFYDSLKKNTIRNTMINTRKVFEKNPNFEEMVKGLTEHPYQAPAYFTVSSARQKKGAIITRYFNQPHEISYLEDWYLVQTNDNRDKTTERRRCAAEKKLDLIDSSDPNLPELVFSKVLSEEPNFMISMGPSSKTEPEERTISTTLIDPTTYRLKVMKWVLKSKQANEVSA